MQDNTKPTQVSLGQEIHKVLVKTGIREDDIWKRNIFRVIIAKLKIYLTKNKKEVFSEELERKSQGIKNYWGKKEKSKESERNCVIVARIAMSETKVKQ